MNNKIKIDQLNKELEKIDEQINMIIDRGDYNDDDNYDDIDIVSNDEYQLNKLSQERNELIERKRRIRAEEEKIKAEKEFVIKRQKYKRGSMVSDNEAIKDSLQREIYAEVLAKYICNKKTETPFNIGIFGDWGEGKSSFLNLIEKELHNTNKNIDSDQEYFSHVIRYDASQYNEQHKIWASIMKELFSKFDEEKWLLGKPLFALKKQKKNMKKNIWKLSISCITFILVVCFLNFVVKKISISNEVNKLILVGTLGIVPIIMAFTNIIIPFIKSQLTFVKPLAERVISNMELPSYDNNLGIREDVKENLEDLLEVWLKKGKSISECRERLVIMVDELDRCSEKVITEFFEALQLFLSVKSIVIVLSINYESVCYALANKYKIYFDKDIKNIDKLEFGIKYVQKYVSIPFFLSIDGSYNSYIDSILNEVNSTGQINLDQNNNSELVEVEQNNLHQGIRLALEEEEKELIKKVLNYLNNKMHITPREIKKIINLIVLAKEISIKLNNMNAFSEKIMFDNFIKWFIFSYFNPKMSSLLLMEIKGNEHLLVEELKILNKNDGKIFFPEDELLAKDLITLINQIRCEEIGCFKKISNCFIFNKSAYIK